MTAARLSSYVVRLQHVGAGGVVKRRWISDSGAPRDRPLERNFLLLNLTEWKFTPYARKRLPTLNV